MRYSLTGTVAIDEDRGGARPIDWAFGCCSEWIAHDETLDSLTACVRAIAAGAIGSRATHGFIPRVVAACGCALGDEITAADLTSLYAIFRSVAIERRFILPVTICACGFAGEGVDNGRGLRIARAAVS